MRAIKYTFSGHESFTCKTLWLKKGYDFIIGGHDFNSPDTVVQLGVGKNMVSSIRFWMRAFGMTKADELTDIAKYLLDSDSGKDPYLEDLGSLWLLHFNLVFLKEASLYNLAFLSFQRERNSFDRRIIQNFIQRILTENNAACYYNENTVKKDIGVCLQSYVLPTKDVTLEEYSSLLIDLDLISTNDSKTYYFNTGGKRQVPWQLFLYAIIKMKGYDNTVSYDILQDAGLIFCMSDIEVINMCRSLESNYPDSLRYSDTAGIRQLQFITTIEGKEVLDGYYK